MRYRFFAAVGIMFVIAGCGGGSGSASSPTSPSPTPTPPPAPLPVAQDPAPRELQGTWLARDAINQQVMLRLTETNYQITRGMDGALGIISVRGDQIDFSRSNVCSGTGSYRWSLTGNSLRFTSIGGAGSDPCSGRSEVLDGYTYTKSS